MPHIRYVLTPLKYLSAILLYNIHLKSDLLYGTDRKCSTFRKTVFLHIAIMLGIKRLTSF